MPQIIGGLVAILLFAFLAHLAVRLVNGFLDLVRQGKARAEVEEEMLKEIRALNAKLDTLLAAANLQNQSRFIPGGKQTN